MINKTDIKKKHYIKIRISIIQKEKWKKACSEKKISLTSLIVNSVENRLMDNERRKVLAFIEKQDNIFGKIENNINQVAKIANSQKFISENEIRKFSNKLSEIIILKKEQNEMFTKIYAMLSR
ncbi:MULTISPECIES: hypothetical protein [Chryseobacterium]|uniref:Plasmid mobilization relaxosome protein MobC n=5 Tax=Chryseobacterium group TaxID=2782232 RepID=A0A3D9BAG1_9FLAO|nr:MULTISPECIES: hypothetical protein [Chryseobacterium]MEC3874953.1 hypothetical protein [Chryseobacterium sp. T9W2-O]REC50615.1 hypothetical protein DRF68_08965 [Candidatus Chryseobacterium massiliae]SIO34190.1 hypothetical protein SAMN05421769_3692 [Chryseobacterium scophthalmum]SIT22811.1 hypothetical protein SAMN05421785_11269 [Chryseobacterium gambrini]